MAEDTSIAQFAKAIAAIGFAVFLVLLGVSAIVLASRRSDCEQFQ